MRILHLTAHMGAGAGKAISGLATADEQNEHTIVILEQPNKLDHIENCREHGITVYVCPEIAQIIELACMTDVVIINWWHNPWVYRILNELNDIECRIILWSHVNGLNYPILSYEFAIAFDGLMLTSKASFENENWDETQRKEIYDKSEIVLGMGSFSPNSFIVKKDYRLTDPIQIGYVGSLDYSKMHPEFVEYCESAFKNVNVSITLYGDILAHLKRDIERSTIKEKISFFGFCSDVPNALAQMDIFIYLLNPKNFATTENAIIEAMAAGLPIITSAGAAERAIIDDGKNGIIVKNKEEFVSAVKKLLAKDEIRKKLGTAAREKIVRNYTIHENLARFHKSLDRCLAHNKRKHSFANVLGDSPYNWFASACNKRDKTLFTHIVDAYTNGEDIRNLQTELDNIEIIFKGKSKGSVFQYTDVFPEDKKLNILKMLLESKS